MSAPAFLATYGERHPSERPRGREGLEALVDRELARRSEQKVAARIKTAKFVQVQTAETFHFEYSPATRKLRTRYLNLLATDLVAEGIGAVFVGGSGLGKTHLARALGYAQCQRGHRVLFTSLAMMVNRLSAAEATQSLHQALKTYQQPALLVVDEVGSVALRPPESHLVFQVISVRHDRKRPTVITTNRIFGEWNQIFADDAVAHAILDRLAERAEVFHLEGKSYRETPRASHRRVPHHRRGSLARESPQRACRSSGSPASPHLSAYPHQWLRPRWRWSASRRRDLVTSNVALPPWTAQWTYQVVMEGPSARSAKAPGKFEKSCLTVQDAVQTFHLPSHRLGESGRKTTGEMTLKNDTLGSVAERKT